MEHKIIVEKDAATEVIICLWYIKIIHESNTNRKPHAKDTQNRTNN